ncbi:MAG: hypothetical protein ACODAJ_16465 [Planctomycetota bacterium]
MLLRQSARCQAGQWYRNPLVAVAAVALALLVILVRSCGCGRSGTEDLPEEVAEDLKGIHVWCPHCNKAFTVDYDKVKKLPGNEPPSMKACQVPCPTCGEADGQQTMQCVHCGAYVPVPGAARSGEELKKCPGCGKYPYGAGPPGRPEDRPPPTGGAAPRPAPPPGR